MALINTLKKIESERLVKHLPTEATYSIIRDEEGELFLQIDTYGSVYRDKKGSKSQSLRFSSSAILELREVLKIF